MADTRVQEEGLPGQSDGGEHLVSPEANAALALVVAGHSATLRQILADLDGLERAGEPLPPEAAELHVAVRVVLAAHCGAR